MLADSAKAQDQPLVQPEAKRRRLQGNNESPLPPPPPPISLPASSSLCYRHRLESVHAATADTADPSTSARNHDVSFLLDAHRQQFFGLPPSLQQDLRRQLADFQRQPQALRTLLLSGMLMSCCGPQLSFLNTHLQALLRFDFIQLMPAEIAIKIFAYLDAKSLCRAAQVSRYWKQVADDDVLWHQMCGQHIEKVCTKCGWGLPLMRRQAALRWQCAGAASSETLSPSETASTSTSTSTESSGSAAIPPTGKLQESSAEQSVSRRPWKEIYAERLLVERNWRNGRYRQRHFEHPRPVACLQVDDTHLVSGSADHHLRVWDLETGKCMRVLEGHTDAVSAVQFDESKIISGSFDGTLKIWHRHSGKCLRTLHCHSNPVTCLHFEKGTLASGSLDGTVCVMNCTTATCVTLSGHQDQITQVQLYGPDHVFSSSLDGTLRLWNWTTKTLVHTFTRSAGINCFQATPFHCAVTQHLESDMGNSPSRIFETLGPHYLVAGDVKGVEYYFDLMTKRCHAIAPSAAMGSSNPLVSLRFNRLRMVTAHCQGIVTIAEVPSRRALHRICAPSSFHHQLSLNDTLVALATDKGVTLYDFGTQPIAN